MRRERRRRRQRACHGAQTVPRMYGLRDPPRPAPSRAGGNRLRASCVGPTEHSRNDIQRSGDEDGARGAAAARAPVRAVHEPESFVASGRNATCDGGCSTDTIHTLSRSRAPVTHRAQRRAGSRPHATRCGACTGRQPACGRHMDTSTVGRTRGAAPQILRPWPHLASRSQARDGRVRRGGHRTASRAGGGPSAPRRGPAGLAVRVAGCGVHRAVIRPYSLEVGFLRSPCAATGQARGPHAGRPLPVIAPILMQGRDVPAVGAHYARRGALRGVV